jgi:hypothetical protein
MDDGSVVVVEIETGTLARVDADGTTTRVATVGGGPNGAAVGPDGKIYVCNNGGFVWSTNDDGMLIPGPQPADYIGGRIQRVDIATGAVDDVYTECDGIGLRGPNDIVFDAHGGFYFTDLGKVRETELDRGGVFYGLVSADLPNGVLAGMVGYFLIRNAAIGYRQFVLRRTLSGISVSDLMQRVVRAVAPELPLDQFVGRYVLGQIDQGFPVLQLPDTDSPQPLLGMMTLRDLRRFQLSEWAFTHVGEAMTPFHRLCALPPGMPAGEAFRVLLESGEEQLPVLDGATLLGVLRRRDLVSYIERRAESHR